MSRTDRPNILVVCGRNKRRSRTAEYIFKNDSRFQIRSVGLSAKSDRELKEKDSIYKGNFKKDKKYEADTFWACFQTV